MTIDYSSGNTPPDYQCTVCGKSDVKLWRELGVLLPTPLYCTQHAAEHEERSIIDMDANGTIPDQFTGTPTDCIGNFGPAVPTEDGTSYWSYTSIPSAGIAWWQALPNQ